MDDFYIVGIGASAGGLEAIQQFFSSMTPVGNMAFVVIQHLSPDYKSYMPELLSRHTEIPVHQIKNGMSMEPGCIYLNPPKYNVIIANDHFELIDQEPPPRVNLAIDMFLESLAASKQERSIGIILSGTGSDGTRGCRAVKEAGGIVIAQNDTAKFDGMPKSVISMKICDYILPPKVMAEVLTRYSNNSPVVMDGIFEANLAETNLAEENQNPLSSIFSILKKQYSTDFSLYKQSTVLRCLDRRMRICNIADIADYLGYLRESPDEVDKLYNSLLIGVTRFFRDRDAFETIKSRIIPEIVAGKPENAVIRVWVAGCSTGEEAYSLAILFKEYMDTARKNLQVKIFATDLDSHAVEFASAGTYPDSISQDVSLERLNRYFIKKRDVYQISKSVREMVIFSIHNIISNAPFYKIDLISCRNMLIYFQQKLQTRILSAFQFALEKNGYLFLGTSETTGELGSYFLSIDPKWKIFKAKVTKKRPLIEDVSILSTGASIVQQGSSEDYTRGKAGNSQEMDDIYSRLVEECLPPSAIADENGDLVQVIGDADKFLKVPRGRFSYDIRKMVPKELSTALATAISKVRKEKKAVTYTNIKIELGEEVKCINLVVKPLTTRKSGALVLVSFVETTGSALQADNVENYDTVGKLQERIADLEQELQYTKESLQTSIEEIETSSEELQSANEELLVSNEELHSTNEELQSVNEELVIVNTQYQYKIQELADLNNDMTNFLNSTTIGTIFLDSNLCVRKFTPAVTREINLIPSDTGRPFSHISHRLVNEDLVQDAFEVLGSLIPSEKEVQSSTGKWYLLKTAPYRTNENVIQGVVISLVDITARKTAEDGLRKSMERYEMLVDLSPFAIMIVRDGKIQFLNSAGVNLFQAESVEKLTGKPIGKYLDLDGLMQADRQYQPQHGETGAIVPVEDVIKRPDGTEINVEVMHVPVDYEDLPSQLVIFRDITYRKLSEKLQMDNEISKRLLEEAMTFDNLKNDFFGNISHEIRTPLNVIMSTLQLLESKIRNSGSKPAGVDLKKHIGIIRQNCYRQLRLINNMIDITKMDSGFYEVKMQNQNIVNVVENITLSVSDYAKAKSIDLIFDTDVEEKIIACSPDCIERIMLNLLSNAVKFTDIGGSINVNMYDRQDRIQICVKDTGAGIPDGKLDIIFDRFRQVDKSLTRAHEGSGIGLSLVKSLVELHNGNISVNSKYGAGSEFIITLPVSTVPDDAENREGCDAAALKSNVERINLEFSDVYGSWLS